MVGATFALMLTLKLVAYACAPPVLRSPSGHTAAAAIILGGLAVALGAGRDRAVLLAAAAGAALIGASRLLLDVHTAPEVALGGLVGIAGALGLSRLAGPPASRLARGGGDRGRRPVPRLASGRRAAHRPRRAARGAGAARVPRGGR